MKKLLTSVFALITCVCAYGQLSFGVKAGANGSFLNNNDMVRMIKAPSIPTPPVIPGPGEPEPTPEEPTYYTYRFPCRPKVSVYFGVFMEYAISKHFAIQPEVVYSREGGYYHVLMDHSGGAERRDLDSKVNFRINYLNVPVMFKYYASQRFSIDLGPQIGFRINSVIKEKTRQYQLKPVNTKSDITTQAINLSLALGVSYRISKSVDTHARFNLGLTEVFKGQIPDGSSNFQGFLASNKKVTANTIQMGFGFRF